MRPGVSSLQLRRLVPVSNEPGRRPAAFSEGRKAIFGGTRRPSGGALSRFAGTAAHARQQDAALPAWHDAVVNGRTLFPTRVFLAHEVPRLLVSGVNSAKIGGRILKGPWAGMPVVTLTLEERATCPDSCGLWRECYGNAMPLARRVRVDAEMLARLDQELRALAAEHPCGFAVRLHVLGDFPDMDYLGHWVRWMAALPALHVWGYTAHRRESPLGQVIAEANEFWPDRWAVRFSVPAGQQAGQHQATTIWRQPEAAVVPEGIVCPAQTHKSQACATCGLCWAPAAAGKRIVFIGHGMRRRGGDAGVLELGEPDMDGMQAASAPADGLALVAQMIEQAAEQRAAAIVAKALDAARDQAWMDGFVQGQTEEREAWHARLRALLPEPGIPFDTARAELGAAGNPGGGNVAEQDGANGQDAAEVERPAAAETVGLEGASEAEAEHDDDEDGQPSGAGCVAPVQDSGPASVAAAGAPPEGPGASPAAAAAPLWQDWRTPAREARVRVLWPRVSLSQRDIWDELKLIDGPAMPSDPANLPHWARKLNLPARQARAAGQPAASNVARGVAAAEQRAAAPVGPPVLPKPSAGRVYASFREIKAWAAHYGIAFDGSNVHVVNAKRKQLGLAPVVVDEDRTAADVA